MKKSMGLAVIISLCILVFTPTLSLAQNQDSHGKKQHNESYAIIIGISDYPGDGTVIDALLGTDPSGMDLFYADDDAQTVKQILLNNYQLKQKNITLLVNSKASKDSILKAIKEVKQKAKSGDEVLFYFSGHSLRADEMGLPVLTSKDRSLNQSSKHAIEANLAPASDQVGLIVWGDKNKQNNSSLSLKEKNKRATDVIWDYELVQAFSNFSTDRIAFVFDSCSSGAFSELAGNGRVLVTATGPVGTSLEYGESYEVLGIGPLPEIGWMNHGALTYFLFIQGIQMGGAPDMDGDAVVSMQEAFLLAQQTFMYLTPAAEQMGLQLEIPVMIDNSNGDFDL